MSDLGEAIYVEIARTSHIDELTDLIWENTDGEDEEATSGSSLQDLRSWLPEG